MSGILRGEPAVDSDTAALDWRPGLRAEKAFLAASALLFLASATVTIDLCKSMSASMPMPGGWTMSMTWMKMSGQSWFSATASFLRMWVVMMVAMMLPSLTPMLLHYRRFLRSQSDRPLAGLTMITAASYFFVWTIAGALAYPVAVTLSVAEMRSPILQRLVPLAIGVVLLLAGIVQLTPWKTRRLMRCRNEPVCRPATSFVRTAWLDGVHLGVDCGLCCAGFMIILIVADLMSLTYMAAITAALTTERLVNNPARVARAIGVIMIAASYVVIARALI
jgi:predicted metal-binding membrane protein